MSLTPSSYRVLTFDCYGTLIDWESGILRSVARILDAHRVEKSDREIIETYTRLESQAERAAYMPYRDLLGKVVEGMGRQWGFRPTEGETLSLAGGVGSWEPFPDTVEALRALHGRYRLAIISNVDDDIFSATARRLKVAFDWVTTAQQARAYKPDRSVFRKALQRMGRPKEEILHVAQSVYHDMVPAAELGLATVRVRRASRAGGFGVSLPARATPDAEVPDLRSLVRLLGIDG
jgi:2-haloacid dehalogenase